MKNTASPRILLVDDDRHLLQSMAEWLSENGFAVTTAEGCRAAYEELGRQTFELAIVDLRLGDGDGFQILQHCSQYHPGLSVILMTGYGTVETGIEALRAGAFDLLTKPLIDEELMMAIRRALAQRAVVRENRQLKAQLDRRFGLENVIGRSRRMKAALEIIESIAETKATILLTGPSGTGKSLLARAIHRCSNRRDQPFVEVACGALPENLLESELFGHVAGAFTGAQAARDGKFKQADGGTLFLDEIGTATPAMQVKLLRVLQEFAFEPIGGNKTLTVDTRVILATNDDLNRAVAEGRFREDLFYRINVITVELPPLRERTEDIPALAEYFVRRVSEESGKSVSGFEPPALEALQAYAWPGNVRELQNVIERAVLLGRNPRIGLSDLPDAIVRTVPSTRTPLPTGSTLKDALAGPERQIILQVLRENQWNRNATADQLGINRTTLYKKMKRLGLESLAPDPASAHD